MSGYYVLKSKGDSWSFALKAGNHETILSSESYESKGGAENGIASVQKNGGDEGNFDKKTSSNGKAFFNLKAGNGQVIGTSEMYESEASRDNGIQSVITNSCSTTVKED